MAGIRRKLINDADNLINHLIEGMVGAHPPSVKIEGDTGRAIVACNGPREGKVGIVVGGGSGHEPAFAGYVGRGLADAAPLGNIFASPSPSQIMDAGFAADGGAGILFLYGNYTGDVMNFGMAEEGLADQGIEARSLVVTDDVASAPIDKAHERRGIAGDFFVFKVAGAAADIGLSMGAVEKAASRANNATRTMGVALSACTMPQTGKSNFSLPVGEMEIGMGIHGEPGIERGLAASADDVVDKLLKPILEELNLKQSDKVAVLVNGLGSTSLLELYILHRRVALVLKELGVHIHMSWVGEYCTSLDMEGASITLMKLDADLQLWLDHPCETPALKVGVEVVQTSTPVARRSHNRKALPQRAYIDRNTLTTSGDISPDIFRNMMMASVRVVNEQCSYLNQLDGVIGDGDHGLTMEIGWKAVLNVLNLQSNSTTITELCDDIAEVFLETVGASVGPLYSSGFKAAGAAVASRLNLDAEALVAWLNGMVCGIQDRGGAALGQKTMLDAWIPAVLAAKAELDAGGSSTTCLSVAAEAARIGAFGTKEITSQMGRSKKLGARSIGHIDPGAESAALLLKSWADQI